MATPIISQERIASMFGNRFGKSQTIIGNIVLGQWLRLDFTPNNLQKVSYKAPKGWSEEYNVAIIHIDSDFVVGMTGSHELIKLPSSILTQLVK